MAERLNNPCMPSAKLSGHTSRYKIKLRGAGYRLVYEVCESELVVVVIAIGKRELNAVYKAEDGQSLVTNRQIDRLWDQEGL